MPWAPVQGWGPVSKEENGPRVGPAPGWLGSDVTLTPPWRHPGVTLTSPWRHPGAGQTAVGTLYLVLGKQTEPAERGTGVSMEAVVRY